MHQKCAKLVDATNLTAHLYVVRYMAGNVLDKTGYACLLPAMIANWRQMWSVSPGTTDSEAPFGIVVLADSTDEGWGSNVPQMHWAQSANHGVAPNSHLPGTFLATAHE